LVYDALISLYNAAGGTDWKYREPYELFGYPWNFTTNPCSTTKGWQGIACSSDCITSSCRVTRISLIELDLVGYIPPQIGNLSALEYLELDKNYLSSSIPPELGNLTSLKQLDLDTNSLTGFIPVTLAALTNLVDLYLFTNALSGPIWSEFGNLVSIVNFQITTTQLTGTIPSTFSACQSMKTLLLNNNLLNGTLSPSLGMIQSMRTIYLYENYFEGIVPPSLGNITLLNKIDVSNNFMTGKLGSYFGNWTECTAIGFDFNFFEGYLPKEIGKLTKATEVYFNNNLFSGPIPLEFYNLSSVSTLAIQYNFLTGSISNDISKLTNLFEISTYENLFSHTIPQNLSSLTKLTILDLSLNLFTGPLIQNFSGLSNLISIVQANNLFTGTIPASVYELTHLEQYAVGINHLTGTIPNLQWHSIVCQDFAFSGNQITGTLPNFIHNLTLLEYLNVSSNYLTGSLNANLNQLSYLVFFDVSYNHFSGLIPPNIFENASYLYDVQLGSNYFTGQLPFFYPNESYSVPSAPANSLLVDISDNAFSGRLPEGLFAVGRLVSIVASINCFTGTLPLSICNNPNLTDLILDGLHSSTTCTEKIFALDPKSSYSFDQGVVGTIPSCIFSLPSLSSFHASGNGLTGSLSNSLQLTEALIDLDLSNNVLKGSIPQIIWNRQFYSLDLSFNKFNGKIASTLPAYTDYNQSLLKLQVNRLSGTIPASLVHAKNINILEGNIFQCEFSGANLPQSDPNYHSYQCDSSFVNYSLIIWGLFVCIMILILLYIWTQFLSRNERRKYFKTLKQMFLEGFFATFIQMETMGMLKEGIDIQHLQAFGLSCKRMMRMVFILSLYLLFVMIPVYGVLTIYYGTYTYQYAWTISFSFYSGLTPAIILFCFLILIVILVLYYEKLAYFYDPGVKNGKNEDDDSISAKKTSNKESNNSQQEPARNILLSMVISFLYFIVILAANISYVAAVDQNLPTVTISLITIALSLFKLLWGNIVVIQFFGQYAEHRLGVTLGSSFLQLISLFNNIMAPYLAEAFVSSNCFLYAITPPPTVTSTFYGQSCILVKSNADDDQPNSLRYDIVREIYCQPGYSLPTKNFGSYGTVQATSISYTPPFAYSYQCSSALLTAFGYVFVYRYLFSGIIQPLLTLYLKRCQHSYFVQYGPESTYFWSFNMLLPPLLRPIRMSKEEWDQMKLLQRDLRRQQRLIRQSEIGPHPSDDSLSNLSVSHEVILTSLITPAGNSSSSGNTATAAVAATTTAYAPPIFAPSQTPNNSYTVGTIQTRNESMNIGPSRQTMSKALTPSTMPPPSSSVATVAVPPAATTTTTMNSVDAGNSGTLRPHTSLASASLDQSWSFRPSTTRATMIGGRTATTHDVRDINRKIIQQIISNRLYVRKSVMIQLVSDVAILLTFGVFFPPLTLVIIFSIAIDLIMLQLMLGRLVNMAHDDHVEEEESNSDSEAEEETDEGILSDEEGKSRLKELPTSGLTSPSDLSTGDLQDDELGLEKFSNPTSPQSSSGHRLSTLSNAQQPSSTQSHQNQRDSTTDSPAKKRLSSYRLFSFRKSQNANNQLPTSLTPRSSRSTERERMILRGLINRVNKSFNGFGNGLWKGISLSLFFAALFWSFSLFDTIGDSHGAVNAIWIVILTVTLPYWLRGLEWIINHLISCLSLMFIRMRYSLQQKPPFTSSSSHFPDYPTSSTLPPDEENPEMRYSEMSHLSTTDVKVSHIVFFFFNFSTTSIYTLKYHFVLESNSCNNNITPSI
jgi:Leucine-rich repeat (LRR) protein